MGSKRAKITIPLSTEGKLKITKIEAAVFQLETAIELWFNDGDPASIVTLAHAAHELLFQMNKGTERPRETVLNPSPDLFSEKAIELGVIDQWPAMFKEDSVFCKHGGADPLKEHHLTTKNLPLVMLDACSVYGGLGYSKRALFHTLAVWMWMMDPASVAPTLSHAPEMLPAIQASKAMGRTQFANGYVRALPPSFAKKGSPVIKTPAEVR